MLGKRRFGKNKVEVVACRLKILLNLHESTLQVMTFGK